MANPISQLPIEYQDYLSSVERRRALAEALRARALQDVDRGPSYTPGRYSYIIPRNPIAQALDMYTAHKYGQEVESADKERQSFLAGYSGGEAGEIAELTKAGTKGDIARFLAHPMPGVRARAEAEQKRRLEEALKVREKVSTFVSDRGDTEDAVQLITGQKSPESYTPSPYKDPTFGSQNVGGVDYAITTNFDKFGRPQATLTRPPSTITNTVSTGDKVELEQFKSQIDQVAPKGASYEAAKNASKSLRSIAEAIGQIEAGATSGTVEPYLQVARGIAAYLGIPNAAAASVDALSAALKSKVLSEQGGLGTQISDADRRFFEEAGGSIATNPEALLRILSYQAVSQMREVAMHNQRVQQLADIKPINPELMKINAIPLNFALPQGPVGKKVEQMIDRLYKGLPSVDAATGGNRPMTPQELRDFYLKQGKGQ